MTIKTLLSASCCALLLVMGFSHSSQGASDKIHREVVNAKQLAKFQTEASELASLWIRYVFGDPQFNPNLQDEDVDCMKNQPAPRSVIMLTGTFGNGATERRCTVPPGKPLFFPVVNCFFGNAELPDVPCDTDADCAEVAPAVCGPMDTCVEAFSVKEKVAICEEFVVERTCDMEVFLNEKILYPTTKGIPLLRAISAPTPGNIFGDEDPKVIASGHWGLLSALAPGEHKVQFKGGLLDEEGNCQPSIDVTYWLNIPGRDGENGYDDDWTRWMNNGQERSWW